MEIYVVGIVIIAAVVSYGAACPTQCTCSSNSYGVYVNCYAQYIGYIPTNLPNTTYFLDLRYNNIAELNVKLCDILPNLIELYISNNLIAQIPDGYFTGCDHLTTLGITSNILTVINERTFTNSTTLLSLNLGTNYISTIHERAFTSMSLLQTLNLAGNRLTTLDNLTFSNCKKIQTLYLDGNKLTTINSALLQPLGELVNLYLNDNLLTKLETSIFLLLAKLGLLHLHNNRMSENGYEYLHNLRAIRELRLDRTRNSISDVFINKTHLKDMSLIQNLQIGNNYLQSLEEDFFMHTSAIRYFYCNNNELTEISPRLIRNLTALYYIDAQNNKIQLIKSGTFTNFPSLYTIHLNGNQIQTIEEYAFANLTNLGYLSLYDNRITVLDPKMFSRMPNLYMLYLYNNKIEYIEQNTFVNLTNLYYLYLYNNDILEVQQNSFLNLRGLRYLALQNNKLTAIKTDLFYDMDKIYEINLDGNNISLIEGDAFVKIPSLQYLYLSSNPLKCDCGIVPFWTWLLQRPILGTNVKCSGGAYLLSIGASEFDKCNSSNCQCYNDGTCTVDSGGKSVCTCVGKWTGDKCSESQCLSYDCGNDSCYIEPVNGSAKCFPKSGFCPNTTTELSTQPTTSSPPTPTSLPCTGVGNRTNKVLGESCGQHGVDGICSVAFSACMQSSSDTGWKCRCAQGYAQKSTSCVSRPNLLFSSQDPYRWTVPISQFSNVTLNLAAVDGFQTSNPTASLTGDGSSYFSVKTSPTNVILSVNGNLDKPNYNLVLTASVTINDIVIREFKEIIISVSPSVITKDIIILDGTPKGSVVVELCKFCSTESNLCFISDTKIPLIINKEGNIETNNLINLDDVQNAETVAYSTIIKVTKNTVIIANLTVIVVRTRYAITLPEDSTLQTKLGEINLTQSFQIKPNEILRADGNSLKLNRTLDYEVERYVEKTFTLEVNSATSQAFDILLTIKVLDVNDNAPKFSLETYNFLAVQSAYKDVIIGVTAATDADSGTLNYTISPNNKLSIDAYGVIRIKEPIVQENYTATVSVDDRKFISSAKIYIELLENTNVNLNRTFANSIPENTNGRIILNVSDSEYENYQFTDHSAIRNFVIDRVSGEVKNVRAFDRENEAERTFKYTVTANKKNQPSCSLVVIGEIIITVTDQNDEKPVFVNTPYNATVKEGPAGSQLTMYLPISTTDKDLNPTVQYSVVSSPTSFSINQATGVITTVSAIDREATPTITITISAFDGTNSATAEITVNVIDINDNAPVFIGTPYSDSILENFIGELYPPVRASDKDIGKNAELTFDLISDGGFFRINQTTGIINVTRPLDRETNEIHLVIIYVRDNGEQILSSSTTATFTVTDVNDNRPMFIQDRITVEVEEGTLCQTPIITVNATDADKPNTNNSLISYSIISGGDDFQINVQTGQLYCKSPLDYENKTTFMLLIKAEDGGTNKLSSNQTVVINVKDINDNFPQFVNPQSAITIRSFAISRVIEKFDVEDKDSGENGKLTLTLNGTAASFLSIDKAGVLRTSTSNAPTGNSYSLIITAKDNGYSPKSSNHSVTVKVSIDTSQPISFSEQEINMNLTENREANTEIGNISYKVDIKQLGINLEYDIITADNSAKFSLNSQTGIITNKYIMDREEQSIYEFVVRAKNKVNYNQSDLALVRISILDVNDNPPKFREANYFYQVSENEPVQTTVDPITTQIIASDIDIDENAKIQFVMLDVDAGGNKECSAKFMLKDTADVNTKSIVLAEKIDYDVLVQKYCRLSIKAFNPNNAMMNSTVIVDINILDYNDNPPEFLDTTGNIYKVSIREDTTINTKIDRFGQLRDRDSRENGDIELSTDNCVFDMLSIDNKIQPRLNSSTKLDYESGITLFTCIIKAQDKGKPVLSATATLSITITDVNDNYPIISNPVISTKVSRYADINTNIVSQIQATDADSGENRILTYSLKPSEHASRFKIDPKTGNISINAPLTSVQADEIYINVQVSDNGSPKLSSDATVIIQITDDNPKPYFGQPTPITIVEHSQLRGGVIIQVKAFDVKDGNVVICDCTYRLDITRTDLVIEADTGIIKFKNSDDSFDREKEPDSRVDVGVIATDKGNPPKNSSLLVIPIIIKDINDQLPYFKKVNYIFSVYQDAPNGTPIGAVIAEDKDQDPITFYSIQITEGDFNSSVSIDKLTGVITKSGNMSLNPNNKNNVEMKGYVYAKDSKDDTKPLIPCAITIIIEFDSKNNHTPNFEKGQYEFDLTWDAEVGYFINKFKATDDDEGNEGVISYSIESGNNRGFFHIGNDGRLTLAYKLDSSIGSENVLKRILILRATDGGTPAKSNSTTVIITISGQNPGLCVQGSAHQSQVTSLEGERNKWSNALYAVVAGLCVAIILMLIFLYKWRTSSPLPSPSPFETNKHKYFSNETAYSDLDRRQTVEYSQSNQAFEPPDPYNKISDKEMCI